MKFGLLLERARAMGIAFDHFATGHYARLEPGADGLPVLKRAVDQTKDQTYFLSRLTREQLAGVLFPLGHLTKQEVKALAREIGWSDVADKDESQNFIESKNYGVLFSDREQTPGPITDTQGKVLGQHHGIVNYTIGQRKGLGLGGTADPLYVVRLDACSNTVVVGSHADLFSRRLVSTDVNWIGLATAPDRPLRVQAKIRQQHQEAPATLCVIPAQNTVEVLFDEPQMSVTPGQVVVFYDSDLVLGSGIITGT